jgi:hypothetical protein
VLVGRWQSVLLPLLFLAALAAAPAATAAEPTFEGTEARVVLGEPVVFSTTVHADSEPQAVELLLHQPSDPSTYILAATLEAAGGGSWTAASTLEGHVVPNTTLRYQFRVTAADGQSALGPEQSVTMTDERFDWQTISGPVVHVHWYSGGDEFARRALDTGETAIAHASELLGVTETEPIDFFIYDDETDFRAALGPGTRENVGGQAHADIRTLFALITPGDLNAGWPDVVIAHELTHLVFNTATDNLYHNPPRWLNEGIAVYLSEGYTGDWQAVVNNSVRRNQVIPLDGLAGFFPTTYDSFSLAYGESVSAIDYFIATYGEQTLWDLVRSYADGVSDDEAFESATGADVAAFNAAWMESLGLAVPEPVGPQPAPPGPVPPDWQLGPSNPPPTPATSAVPAPSRQPDLTPPTGATPVATPPAASGATGEAVGWLLTAVVVLAALAVLVILGLMLRNRRPWQPPE